MFEKGSYGDGRLFSDFSLRDIDAECRLAFINLTPFKPPEINKTYWLIEIQFQFVKTQP